MVIWIKFTHSRSFWTSLVAQMVKHLPTMWETCVRSLGWKDPLEKEMAPHSSTLAWKIPWTEDPGRPQFMGSQRVRHDWVTSFSLSLSIPVPFSSLIPKIAMFTLAIFCFTVFNLPWFMDLTFQVPSNIVLYSIRLYFHHQTHLHLSVISTLVQLLHSFWSYFSALPQ